MIVGLIVELLRFQIADQPSDDFVGVGDLRVVRTRIVRRCASAARTARAARPDAGTGTRATCRSESSQRSATRSDSAPSRWSSPTVGRRSAAARRRRSRSPGRCRFPCAAGTTETTPPVAKPRSRSICGSSRSLGLDDEADVVAHAGFERQPAGQQRRVRRQRLRRVRVGALEDDAVGARARRSPAS